MAVLQIAVEGQPFAELVKQLIDLDNMQPIGREVEVVEFGPRELHRALLEIHIDALNEEEKAVKQLPQSDPTKGERLYDLSRRNVELTRRRQALLQQSRTSGR